MKSGVSIGNVVRGLLVWVAIAAALLACGYAPGCTGSAKVEGGRVEAKHEVETISPADPAASEKPAAGVVLRIERESVTSTGGSMRVPGDAAEAVGQFDSSPPDVALGSGTRARGSGTKASFKIEGDARTGLLVFSGVLALIGAGLLYFRVLSAAIGVFACAALALVGVIFPWALLGIVVLLVAGVVWYAVRWARSHDALGAVVTAVERSPEPIAKAVKEEVAKQADGRMSAVRKTIGLLKVKSKI